MPRGGNHVKWTPERRAALADAVRRRAMEMTPEARAEKARQLAEGKRRAAAARAAGALPPIVCRRGAAAVAPARAVKGSRDARPVLVAAGNDGCAMPTTPLGVAVREARSGLAVTNCTDVSTYDVERAGPPRPEWLPVHGAPAGAHRTNGDLGRGVAHLLEGVAERIVDAIVPRLQSALGPQRSPVDPLRPRLVALARLAVAMAHRNVKGGTWLDATSAVSRAALDLEADLAREPRS